MTGWERKLAAAVESSDLWTLHSCLRDMLDSGFARDELLARLENVHTRSREPELEQLADFVLDGMDFLTAWCAPSLALSAPGSV
jgi:hypothetical protein